MVMYCIFHLKGKISAVSWTAAVSPAELVSSWALTLVAGQQSVFPSVQQTVPGLEFIKSRLFLPLDGEPAFIFLM